MMKFILLLLLILQFISSIPFKQINPLISSKTTLNTIYYQSHYYILTIGNGGAALLKTQNLQQFEEIPLPIICYNPDKACISTQALAIASIDSVGIVVAFSQGHNSSLPPIDVYVTKDDKNWMKGSLSYKVTNILSDGKEYFVAYNQWYQGNDNDNTYFVSKDGLNYVPRRYPWASKAKMNGEWKYMMNQWWIYQYYNKDANSSYIFSTTDFINYDTKEVKDYGKNVVTLGEINGKMFAAISDSVWNQTFYVKEENSNEWVKRVTTSVVQDGLVVSGKAGTLFGIHPTKIMGNPIYFTDDYFNTYKNANEVIPENIYYRANTRPWIYNYGDRYIATGALGMIAYLEGDKMTKDAWKIVNNGITGEFIKVIYNPNEKLYILYTTDRKSIDMFHPDIYNPVHTSVDGKIWNEVYSNFSLDFIQYNKEIKQLIGYKGMNIHLSKTIMDLKSNTFRPNISTTLNSIYRIAYGAGTWVITSNILKSGYIFSNPDGENVNSENWKQTYSYRGGAWSFGPFLKEVYYSSTAREFIVNTNFDFKRTLLISKNGIAWEDSDDPCLKHPQLSLDKLFYSDGEVFAHCIHTNGQFFEYSITLHYNDSRSWNIIAEGKTIHSVTYLPSSSTWIATGDKTTTWISDQKLNKWTRGPILAEKDIVLYSGATNDEDEITYIGSESPNMGFNSNGNYLINGKI